MVDDGFRAGEKMAIDWIEGRSEMTDDLAALVAGMPRELDAMARGFLVTIGNAARRTASCEAQPAPGAAPTPPAVPPPAAPSIDVDTMWARARERQRKARFEEFARRNAELPVIHGLY